MQVVIVEDERLTAQRLKNLINKNHPDLEVKALLPSVSRSLKWFQENDLPDLIFLDIQLNDGTGFELLQSLKEPPPIIFTTAYNQHAIKAFKYQSIDYLLKPINADELAAALYKFDQLNAIAVTKYQKVNQIIHGDFKQRFLIKVGDQYQKVSVHDVAYFQSVQSMTYLHDSSGNKWPLDLSLDQIEKQLNPLDFFRINRKFLLALTAIKEIHQYFGSRLLLNLQPELKENVIVSRVRVADFKRWMDA